MRKPLVVSFSINQSTIQPTDAPTPDMVHKALQAFIASLEDQGVTGAIALTNVEVVYGEQTIHREGKRPIKVKPVGAEPVHADRIEAPTAILNHDNSIDMQIGAVRYGQPGIDLGTSSFTQNARHGE